MGVVVIKGYLATVLHCINTRIINCYYKKRCIKVEDIKTGFDTKIEVHCETLDFAIFSVTCNLIIN